MEELIKDNFAKWYSTKGRQKYCLEICFACLEKTSDYAISKHVSINAFYDIKDYKMFNVIRNKLMANKLFKFYDKRNFVAFDKIGQYYSLFLKNQDSNLVNSEDNKIEMPKEKVNKIDFIDFQQWLMDNKGLTSITSNNYKRAIEKLIDRDYKINFISYLEKNDGSLLKAIENLEIYLKQDDDYLRLDKVNHGTYRAAIAKIKEYIPQKNDKCTAISKIEDYEKIEDITIESKTFENSNNDHTLDNEVICIDWKNLLNYIYTIPICYEIDGIKNPVNNWATLLVSFCKYMLKKDTDIEITALNWNGSKRKLWSNTPNELIAPKQLKEDLYVESNYSAGQVASFIKALAEHYRIDLSKFNVYYKEKIKAHKEKMDLSRMELTVDFDNEENLYPFARPLYFILHGIKEEESTWIDCLVDISKELLINANNIDLNILNFITNTPKNLNEDHYATRELYDGYYIQILFQVKAIVKAIKKVLDFTNTPYDDCILAYKTNKTNKMQKLAVNNISNKTNILDDDYSVNKIINILREKFSKGFVLNSIIDMKKFKRFFNEIYDEECWFSDDDIKSIIEHNTIAIDDNRMFLIEQVVSSNVLNDIKKYIEISFENSKIIYYKIIFNAFKNRFFTTRIYDEKVLKAVLQKEFCNQYFFKRSYMSIENVEIGITDEIKKVLIDAMCPLSIEEIVAKLSYVSESKIKSELAYHEEFISTGDKKYFHIECFEIKESELILTENIIRDLILENGYASKKDVIMNIETMDYISENILFNAIGISKALAYLLKDKFEYNGFIFSNKNNIIDINKILSNYVQRKEKVSLGELGVLAEDIGLNSLSDYYLSNVYNTHVRIDRNSLIRKDEVQFDVELVDKTLSKYITNGYCSFGNIKDYALFPSGKLTWNENLLQTYLRFYSGRFKYLTDSISLTRVVGAIVDKSSCLEDINEIMAIALANSYIELNTNDALSFLVDEKYLATRRFKNIETILEKAKGIRG